MNNEKTIRKLINAKAKKISNYAEVGFNTQQVIELMQEFAEDEPWISVNDDLPELGEDVIVFIPELLLDSDKDRSIMVGHTMDKKGDVWIIGNNFSFDIGEPTHWRPRPNKPNR